MAVVNGLRACVRDRTVDTKTFIAFTLSCEWIILRDFAGDSLSTLQFKRD